MQRESGANLGSRTSELMTRLVSLASQGRSLVAIAGAPGSGKTTLSDTLCAQLNAQTSGLAAVVQMDGFHFDDAVLRAQGNLARKGAPFTFDVGGLRSLLERLRANRESEIAVPVFDRELEISRGCARVIPQDVRIILVEGNYLLLDEVPWTTLHPLFDFKIALHVPLHELERRLIDRWVALGLDRREAVMKAQTNDLKNARLVVGNSITADFEPKFA